MNWVGMAKDIVFNLNLEIHPTDNTALLRTWEQQLREAAELLRDEIAIVEGTGQDHVLDIENLQRIAGEA